MIYGIFLLQIVISLSLLIIYILQIHFLLSKWLVLKWNGFYLTIYNICVLYYTMVSCINSTLTTCPLKTNKIRCEDEMVHVYQQHVYHVYHIYGGCKQNTSYYCPYGKKKT